jgi:hypothetical protein
MAVRARARSPRVSDTITKSGTVSWSSFIVRCAAPLMIHEEDRTFNEMFGPVRRRKTGMRKQVSKMHGVSSKSCPRRSPPLGSLSLRHAG